MLITAAPWVIRITTASLLPGSACAFVAGHRGPVGSAVARRPTADGHAVLTRARAEPDLRDATRTAAGPATLRPDVVELAATKVGGIMADGTPDPPDRLVHGPRRAARAGALSGHVRRSQYAPRPSTTARNVRDVASTSLVNDRLPTWLRASWTISSQNRPGRPSICRSAVIPGRSPGRRHSTGVWCAASSSRRDVRPIRSEDARGRERAFGDPSDSVA